MKLFLAEVTIVFTPYMSMSRTYKELRIVRADTEIDAREKVEKFYYDKGEANGDSYWVEKYTLSEEIA